GEEEAGDVPGRRDHACSRRVDPVIMARTQVDRREGAALESFRLRRVVEEVGGAIPPALRLDQPALGDAPYLPDDPVDGRAGDRIGARPRPRAGAEPANEELVERSVLLQRELRLGDVDPDGAGEGAEHGAAERAGKG